VGEVKEGAWSKEPRRRVTLMTFLKVLREVKIGINGTVRIYCKCHLPCPMDTITRLS
jgi:hypothetical protein